MNRTAIKTIVKELITEKIIELHNKGYEYDFNIMEDKLTCLQDDTTYALSDLLIELVYQYSAPENNYYRYIHTIENISGKNGLLLIEKAYISEQK